MPNKCCVRRCISGQEKYRTVDTQIHLFKLPSSKDEPERRKTWIDALEKHNGDFAVNDYTVVCEKSMILV